MGRDSQAQASAVTKRSPRVALVGAYDRFNYGDLLFPLVTAQVLGASAAAPQTTVYSLTQSDLSRFGALPTQPIGALYDGSFLRDGDICMVNGGGVLAVDWIYVYANTLGHLGNRVLQRLERLVGQPRLDRWVAARFGGRACAPFVMQPADFTQQIKVVYNAVGGGAELRNLSDSRRQAVLQALARADYLSFRDDETMAVVGDLVPAHLAPDSAVLMSRHFPLETLVRLASPQAVQAVQGDYVCLQAYLDFGQQHLSQIRALIEAIYQQTGLPVLLLPIGRYPGLDDHLFLAALARQLQTPHILFSDQASVHDIMLAIAKARLFIGTSLHGQITAQSFAVPHLGLGLTSPKLAAYLRTWDLPIQSACLDIAASVGAMATVKAVLSISKEDLAAKRDQLVGLAQLNFNRLFAAAGLH